MKFNAPDHFSHNFELKIEHLPTKKSDRIALSILYPGLFFGTILVALGLYELCNGFRGGKNAFDMSKGSADFAATETFMAPWVFDFAFIALGIKKSLLTTIAWKLSIVRFGERKKLIKINSKIMKACALESNFSNTVF